MNRTLVHLQHMIDAIDELESARDDDLNHIRNKRYVERNLEILGEAARRISRDIQEQYTAIPWADIIGTRNVIAHDYERISPVILKSIVRERVLPLRAALHAMLHDLQKDIR